MSMLFILNISGLLIQNKCNKGILLKEVDD